MSEMKFKIAPLKGVENYVPWKSRVTRALKADELWGEVEPAQSPQSSGGSGGSGASSSRNNYRALHVITAALDDSLLHLIEDCDSARDAWQSLHRQFAAAVAGRVDLLMEQLQHLHMSAHESMESYMSRASTLQVMLHDAGHPITEHDAVRALIRGLPAQYDGWRTSVEVAFAAKQLKMLEISPLLLAEYGKRMPAHRMVPSNFVAPKKAQSAKEMECWKCGEKGHLKKDCKGRKEEPDAAEEPKPRKQSQRAMAMSAICM